MKSIKNLLQKLLHISIKALAVFVLLSIILLFVIFFGHKTETFFAYIVYLFSTYTLSLCIITIIKKICKYKTSFFKISIFHKYVTDLNFKAELSLYLSLGINLIYSVYKAFAGIYYHSLWFGTVACYYILLSIERFFLLHHIRKKSRNYTLELRRYCLCGYLLFTLTIVIISMSVYMIHEGQVTIYPGHIIYAAAGYTFYNFINATVNIVKYKKVDNPLYHASKMITFATSLISIFSLQTAMFAEFGDDYAQQRIMNISTSFCVFMLTIGISLYMIIRSKILLNKENKT